jgi:peptidoglycan/LPS O-acetylase OafA/YrhL
MEEQIPPPPRVPGIGLYFAGVIEEFPDRMKRHVHGLDLLRAVAIGLVVFEHAALFFHICYGTPVIWAETGTFGVTLFFALSGFLIGGILLDLGDSMRDPAVAGRFWLRRALRTLPSYYLFIGVNLAYWHLVQRARGYPDPLPLVPRYLFFLQNFDAEKTWFFGESWSLSVEEWFYLAFPVALFAGLRFLKAPFRRLYAVLTAAMIAVPILLRALVLSQAEWQAGINQVVLYRPDSIALGLAAVAVSRRSPGPWSRLRLPAGLGGLALLAGTFLYMGLGDPDHSAVARVFLLSAVSMGCVLLLPWGSTCTDLGGPAINGAVGAVARWSYSMYLVNLILSATVLSHMQFHHGTAAGILSYAAACLGASAALYHGFEAPLLRWRDRRIPMARSRASSG